MKRLLIIILVTCFVVSIGIVALAKVKFSNWDRWDEQLPPENSKNWNWVWPSKKPEEFIIKGAGILGDDLIILSSDLYYGKKFDKKSVSVCLYLLGDVSGNDLDSYISNTDIALAVFLSKKDKIIVRAYKRKADVLKFFEEWEIEYEIFKTIRAEAVIPSQSIFMGEFKKWLESISSLSQEDITENLLNFLFPEILVADTSFVISTREVTIKK